MTQATRRVALSAPWIDERDEELVLETLRSGHLSLGPTGPRFEELLADAIGARYCAAVSSGTAGLHLGMVLAGVGPGDEVITSPYSFVASANCAIYEGATPVFADIHPRTYNLDPEEVEAAVTERTKAIVAVAERYSELLSGIDGLELPLADDPDHERSWFVYVVALPAGTDREAVIGTLTERGIATARYLPCIHLQSYMRERYGFREGMCPVSEDASARTLALPFFTRLERGAQERVTEILSAAL